MRGRISGLRLAWIGMSVGVFSSPAVADLRVMTTVPDLRALVQEIGGDRVQVESFARGSQDPHFLEAKPSFMLKASQADLVVAIGLELEAAWLPAILKGARNAKIQPGTPGYLELGPTVERFDVRAGEVSRAEGDVHPAGNPHVTLDPVRMGQMAGTLAGRLAELDPAGAAEYKGRAQAFQARMKDKTAAWKLRLEKTGIKEIVTYHKTLSYFLSRFGIRNVQFLEPKPGVPPTGGHVLGVAKSMRSQGVRLILVENYFSLAVAEKVRSEVPHLRIESVPVSVNGASAVSTLDELYEALVKAIEGSGK